MDTLLQDLRFSLRQLVARPGFTAIIILTLALGIGASTAVFGVLDRAVLRPLPVAEPGRLVHVVIQRPDPAGDPSAGSINANLSYPAYRDLRERTTVFGAVIAHVSAPLALEVGGQTERIEAAGVCAGFFTALGASLALGRDLLPEEDQPGAPQRVVVLGHSLWQRRFGGDRDILGRAVTLDGKPYTVIGVAAAGFPGLTRGAVTAAYVPVTTIGSAGDNAFNRRTVSWLDVFARLAPGVSRDAADAGMALLSRQLEAASLLPAGNRLLLQDGGHGLTSLVAELARPLAVLMGAVLLVLVVACANVASLLVARAMARRREIAIRLSIGGGRLRLARQLITESLVLGILGGSAGLVAAFWIDSLMPALPTLLGAPLLIESGLDARLLAFAAVITTLTALGFGLFPALRASRVDLVTDLKEGPATTATRQRVFGRDMLVTLQIAITFVLVVGAGLMVRTARTLQHVDPGFEPRNVLLAGVDLESRGYGGAEIVAFWDRLIERLQHSPGVTAASVALTMVPTPGGMRWDGVPLEGHTGIDDVDFDANVVGPGYFTALRIPVVSGRPFDDHDRHGATQVAVINEAMARRYWPDRSSLGRGIGDSTSRAVVVGVVRDGKYRSLREAPRPVVYYSALQSPVSTGTLIVRTRAAPLAVAPQVRAAVHELEPGVPLYDVRTLESHLALASARERLVAGVSVLFGGLALVLALVGLSGLLAFVVSRRTGEIALRMALGARPMDVLAMILRRGLTLVCAGIAVGLVGAVILGRVASDLLYGVAPTDLRSYGIALLLVTVAAAVASYLPARRAARVDPMVALRQE